jgi:hypothetical protein
VISGGCKSVFRAACERLDAAYRGETALDGPAPGVKRGPEKVLAYGALGGQDTQTLVQIEPTVTDRHAVARPACQTHMEAGDVHGSRGPS